MPSKKGRTCFVQTEESQVLWALNIQRRYNISKTTRWRWEASGALPPRDLFIGRRSGWRLATILAFEAARPRPPAETL